MKELLMIFAVVITLAVGVEMLPVMGNPRKLAVAEKIIGKPLGEPETPLKLVSKHNLNRGQLKKMHWLRYVDKV